MSSAASDPDAPMPEKPQDLDRLSRLLTEGQLTEQEFSALRSMVLDPAPALDVGDLGSVSTGSTPPGGPATSSDVAYPKTRTHPSYWLTVVSGGLAWFFGKEFGLVAWAGALVAAVVLNRVQQRKGRWMAWVALALSVIYAFANAVDMGHIGTFASASNPTSTPTTGPEYPPDSFGTTVDDMKSRWNKMATEHMNLAHLSLGKLYTEKGGGPHGLNDVWFTFDDGSRFTALADNDGWVYEVGVVAAGQPSPLIGKYFIQQVSLLARTKYPLRPNSPNDIFELLGLGELDNWRAGYWVTKDYRDETWEVLMLNEGVAVSVYPQESTLFH